MQTQPLISCIVIFFNAKESFFIEAIASIFNQTYEHWELLLADDGSTNQSTHIALQYAEKYPHKIRYLEHEHHQNRGMSATRNLGIHHAQGEYIAFLDADDVWLPQTLSEQLAILIANPSAAMVYGPLQWWYSWTNLAEDQPRDYVESYVADALVPPDQLVKPPALFVPILQGKICISGMLTKRQAIEQVGGFESAFTGLYEDQVFCAKICLEFPVFVASQWWYKYRQHPNSCCAIAESQKTEYWLFNRPEFLSWIEQYLQQKKCQDDEIWHPLKQEQWPLQHPLLHVIKRRLLQTPPQVLAIPQKTKRLYQQTRRLIKTTLLVRASSSKSRPMNTPAYSQPLVSVVIIFFNAKTEQFFEEAIASVFAQTYSHWELLLADDGSTDESSAIAQQYAQDHPQKVHYLEHPNHQNLGMSAARNLGVRQAKGKYIAFLDADDIWLPHKLAEQIPLLERHPEAAMIYGKTQFWFTWCDNNPVSYFSYTRKKPANPMALTSKRFNQIIHPPHQLLVYLKNRNIYPCSCSMVIRRQAFDILGGFEETFRDAHEDMVFHSKIFLQFPVYVSSRCWDRYRIHPNSYWRTVWKEGQGHAVEQANHLKYLNWLEAYVSTLPGSYPRVKKALHRAFLPYQNPILHHLIMCFQHPLKSIKKGLKLLQLVSERS